MEVWVGKKRNREIWRWNLKQEGKVAGGIEKVVKELRVVEGREGIWK